MNGLELIVEDGEQSENAATAIIGQLSRALLERHRNGSSAFQLELSVGASVPGGGSVGSVACQPRKRDPNRVGEGK